MTVEILRKVLGLCALINMGVLIFWFLMVVCLHDLVYRAHTKLFKISEESFNAIHYTGILFFKIIIFFFNVIPYIVLLILA